MKTGESVETFVFVQMINSAEWRYCRNPIDPAHEFRYSTFDQAIADAEELAKAFKGKQLFLIKETSHVLTSIKYDGKFFNSGVQGTSDKTPDDFYALAVEEKGGYNIINGNEDQPLLSEDFFIISDIRDKEDSPEGICILRCKVVD